MSLPIILASSSERRIELLKRINIIPDKIIAPDIEEIVAKGEKPREFATRMSVEKATVVAAQITEGIVIAADTVVVCGGKIIEKAENDQDVYKALKILSGRRQRIYTAVTVIKKHSTSQDKIITKLVCSIVKFKRLSEREIKQYCETKEGIGKAGAWSMQGYAEAFVSHMSGSFSNIVGLPLYETKLML